MGAASASFSETLHCGAIPNGSTASDKSLPLYLLAECHLEKRRAQEAYNASRGPPKLHITPGAYGVATAGMLLRCFVVAQR